MENLKRGDIVKKNDSEKLFYIEGIEDSVVTINPVNGDKDISVYFQKINLNELMFVAEGWIELSFSDGQFIKVPRSGEPIKIRYTDKNLKERTFWADGFFQTLRNGINSDFSDLIDSKSKEKRSAGVL